MRSEKDLERALHEATRDLADYHKLHGSMYQPGLPDVMLVGPAVVLVELKYTDAEDPRETLRGSQVSFFLRAAAHRSRTTFLLAARSDGSAWLWRSGTPAAAMPLQEAFSTIRQAILGLPGGTSAPG